MAKIVGNLKELIDDSAAGYINLNVEKFRSTTPGPEGPTGATGPRGIGIHHMKGTSTTDLEGDFSTAGEYDTYTFYADADEQFPIAWFTVRNGEDPYLRAVDVGYRGTEEEFYTMLGMVEYYAEVSLEAMTFVEAARDQVALDAAQVAADKVVVEDARVEVESNTTIVETISGEMQELFLGTHSVDPTTDNDGNPLKPGVIYYNDVQGTLKIWDGTEWDVAAFSVDGTVNSFNGREGAVLLLNADVTGAVGKDLTDAIKYSEADKVLTDVNKVSLSTDTSLVAGAGEMTWNPDERTLDVGLGDGVVLQAGQEMMALVRNGTSTTISDGTVVMLTGSVGNSGRLVVAPYDGVSDASLIVGITTEVIAAGADGFVTSYGKIRGINTSMWSDGDVLYVNGGTLATTPTSGLSMKIAAVVTSHTNGTLMVRVNGYSQVKEW